MEIKEIFEILKNCANFTLSFKNGNWYGCGAINYCSQCEKMSYVYYCNVHYPIMAKMLEALPWTKIVSNPRFPHNEEYPSEPGRYITMLDCDEHYVLINTYDGQNWSLYNNTHVKWWMPLPDMSQIEKLLDSIYNGK